MRQIRSFVRRQGRMTDAQTKAFEQLAAQHCLPLQPGAFKWTELFLGKPLVLEIGFGMGDSLATMAKQNPHWGFIGVEVHTPGVGRLLRLIEEQAISNLKIIHADAVTVLETLVSDPVFDRVHLYFPDPWPKKRHHKRRLIQAPFLTQLKQALKPNGILHMATDWEPYAEWILNEMHSVPDYEPFNTAVARQLRADTKFEARGVRLGHRVSDLVYQRV